MMSREMKALEAKSDAQAFMIDLMLQPLIKAGLLDPAAMIESIDNFVDSPTSINADAVSVGAMRSEMNAWAEVLHAVKLNMQLSTAV